MAALTVVFDLDGTLVDTAPDLIETLNVVFAREGLPPVDYAAARNMIGGGARRMIEAGLQHRRPRCRPSAKSIGCLPISSRITRPISPTARSRSPASTQRSIAWPHAAAALRSAPTSSKGCRGCCSTRSASPGALRAICGQDTFGMQKPDPEILRRTIRGGRRRPATGGHGGRFRHRYRHRARRRRSGRGGRFRLQRDAGQGARARPADQPFRRACGGCPGARTGLMPVNRRPNRPAKATLGLYLLYLAHTGRRDIVPAAMPAGGGMVGGLPTERPLQRALSSM